MEQVCHQGTIFLSFERFISWVNGLVSFVCMYIIMVFQAYSPLQLPTGQESFDNLSKKKFSDETNKKVKWVHGMYYDWREVHNGSGIDYIACDIEDRSTITVDDFIFGMKRFITEVRKLDNNNNNFIFLLLHRQYLLLFRMF